MQHISATIDFRIAASMTPGSSAGRRRQWDSLFLNSVDRRIEATRLCYVLLNERTMLALTRRELRKAVCIVNTFGTDTGGFGRVSRG
jgi:hypothetical protein